MLDFTVSLYIKMQILTLWVHVSSRAWFGEAVLWMLTVLILMYSKQSAQKCGNPFCPWQCPYPLGRKRIIFERQVGVKSTQKEEDRRREKRQRGTTDCGQHWTCALRWSLFPPRVTFLAGCNFYVPPWACSLVFLPHLMRHFSDVCHWWTHSELYPILPLGEQICFIHS